MKQIQFLFICLCSAGLLAGCADTPNSNKVAANATPAKTCASDQVQTGSMIHSHSCAQSSNSMVVDKDSMNPIYNPGPSVRPQGL